MIGSSYKCMLLLRPHFETRDSLQWENTPFSPKLFVLLAVVVLLPVMRYNSHHIFMQSVFVVVVVGHVLEELQMSNKKRML